MEADRRTLSQLLLGQPDIPQGGTIDLELGQPQKTDGVWIRSVSFSSLPYPVCEVNDNGEVINSTVIERVPGIILEPVNKANHLGGVTPHQHAMEFDLGKSEPAGLRVGNSGPGYAYGRELARQGYTVICFDFLPFEDRRLSHPGVQDYFGERFIKQEATLDGMEPMGIHVLDTMRAVDVLLQEFGVDKVGVIGHSLGGMVAVHAMALDPRLVVGVSNCGVASFRSVREQSIVHNWAWSIKRMLPDFGEIHHLFELIEPRPILISAAIEDEHFPIDGVREMIRWAQQLNCNPELFEFSGRHTFPEDARKNAYLFLEMHLQE